MRRFDDTSSRDSAKKKISRYLLASAGTCNWPTDRCVNMFVTMVSEGEVDMEDIEQVGGKWLVDIVKTAAEFSGIDL